MATQKENKLIFDIREYEFRDNKSFNKHNQDLYKLINYVLKNEEEQLIKQIALTKIIFEVTDNKLLFSTLNLFVNVNLKNLSNNITKQIVLQDKALIKPYTEEELTRISSIVLSVYLRKQILEKANFDNRLLPKFEFILNGYMIEFFDIYEVSNKFQKHFFLNIDKFLNLEIEKKEFINYILDYDYINDTSKFKKDIKYLKNKIESKITHKDNLEVESKDIFKSNGIDLFLKWEEICKEEPRKKYSYIFQKLKELEKLRKTDLKSISSWLYEKSYITKDIYGDFLVLNYFITPKNILSKGRNRLFDTIK